MDERPILDRIRVLDLSTGIAGPQCAAMLLAEAGADVIKIEPPGGDRSRGTAGFAVWNRSKRGIVLDLHQDEGLRRLERLLEGADVLIHSLRPAKRRAGWGWTTTRSPAASPRSSTAASPAGRRGIPNPTAPATSRSSWPPAASAMSSRGRARDQSSSASLRKLVRGLSRRGRYPRPPDPAPAHRRRRSRAHEPAPGRTRADEYALDPGRAAESHVQQRPWEGCPALAVRVCRWDLDPHDARSA